MGKHFYENNDEYMIVTPSGLDYSILKPEDLPKVSILDTKNGLVHINLQLKEKFMLQYIEVDPILWQLFIPTL